jgi:hypothetical protein
MAPFGHVHFHQMENSMPPVVKMGLSSCGSLRQGLMAYGDDMIVMCDESM